MNKIFLSLLFSVAVFFVCAQTKDAKEILLKCRDASLKVNSASYHAELFMKWLSGDTSIVLARVNVAKDSSNQSGVVGRMDLKDYVKLQFIDKGVIHIKNSAKYTIDTISFKRGFEGNIISSAVEISFLQIKPLKALNELGHSYFYIDSLSNNEYDVVMIKNKTTKGSYVSYIVYWINKSTNLVSEYYNFIYDKTQNQTQIKKLSITNLSINDDSAFYYLNNFKPILTDTVVYEKKYIAKEPIKDTIAPDFTFRYWNKNDSLTLSKLKGKFVIADFSYINCYPCQKAVPALIKLKERNPEKLIVFWVDPFDKPEKLSEFVAKNKINFDILLAQRKFAENVYRVPGYPTMFLINPEGKIVKTHIGFSVDDDKKAIKHFIQEIEELIK